MVAQAQRIINVMRDTVDKTTRNGAKIGYRYGVVGGMVGAGEVTVMLAADDVLTEGIRITDGAYLNAGDYVLVAQTEEGDSWIEKVLAYSGNFVLGLDPQRGRIYAPTSPTQGVPPTYGSPGTEGQLLFSGGATGKVYWGDNYAVELRLEVKNTSGSTIGAGKVVYITGASGQVPTVSPADADFEATSASTIGVTTGSIANNDTGFIITKGVLRGINTSAYVDGTEVWLSPGAGDFTDTKPPAPQHAVRVGNIVKSHVSSGEILVDIHNGYELGELHDVRLGSLTDGEVLSYNSSSGYWTNSTGGGVSYGAVTSETSFGVSPANGVATTVARSDHTHGTPTNPVTAHEGAADPHTGYLQESVISGLGTPSLTLSTSNSAGAGTTVIGAGATIAAFDATAPTTAAFGAAAAAGSAGFAARRDHTHGMMANPVTSHEAAADPHTGYVLESTGATQTIVSTNTAATPLIVKGASGQSADIFIVQNNAGSELFSIEQNGTVRIGADIVATEPMMVVTSPFFSGNLITAGQGTIVPLTIRGASDQSADIFVVENSSGSDYLSVTAAGVVEIGADRVPVITSTAPTVALGTAASAGSSTTALRDDATILAFDATVPTTASFGASAATGAATVAARRDHTHGMMANPVTAHEAAADPHTGYLQESVVSGLGTPALTLSTTNSAGTGTTVIGAGATIAAFDATAPTTASFGAAAATGSAGVAARRDHAHGMMANPTTSNMDGNARVNVKKAGVSVGTRRSINLIEGSNVTLTVADDSGNEEVDITIASSGAGASFATPTIALGTAAAAGIASTVIRSDSTIAAFDTTVPTTIAYGAAAATGSAAFAARRDHTHGMISNPVLDQESSTITLSGSVVETDFFNYSVPGGTLGTANSIRVKAYGTLTNNTGGNRTVTVKVVYGATTMFADVTPSIATNASARAWTLDFSISANNATNAQRLGGHFMLGAVTNAANGTGDFAGTTLVNVPFYGTAAEDSTAAKTLKITWTHGANDANLSTVRAYASAVLE